MRFLIILMLFISCQVDSEPEKKEWIKKYKLDEVTSPNDTLTFLKKDMSLVSGEVRDFVDNSLVGKHLIYKAQYQEGRLHGKKITWDDWWGNKTLEGNYINGRLEGDYKEWYDDGQIKIHHKYKNGERDGPQRGWYENGQINHEVMYLNGKKHGKCEFRNTDGTLESNQAYKDGEIYPNHRLLQSLEIAISDTSNEEYELVVLDEGDNHYILTLISNDYGFVHYYTDSICFESILTPYSKDEISYIKDELDKYYTKSEYNRWWFLTDEKKVTIEYKDVPEAGLGGFKFELE